MAINTKSANAKIELLLYGFRINSNALHGLGTIYKEYQYGYNDSNWARKKRLELLPSELLLPGGIVVAPHIRPSSPYLLAQVDGDLVIINELKDTILTKVKYLPRPKLWEKVLKDGSSLKKYVNVYGKDCLNVFIYATCDFWDHGLPCSFCSLKPTQTKHQYVEIKKKPENIFEAVCIAFDGGDTLNWMIITGGSMNKRDDETNMYCTVLNKIKKTIPSKWNGNIKGNCALLPDATDKSLRRLHNTGIEHPSFNLEVWGEERFTLICPGKEKYFGYSRILDCYKKAAQIWGHGKVWCNFVGGLTPIDDLKEGLVFMADLGVVPGANIFHPDPGAPIGDRIEPPSRSYIDELYGFLGELYHSHNFSPFFNAGVLRNSLSNEYYHGWI